MKMQHKLLKETTGRLVELRPGYIYTVIGNDKIKKKNFIKDLIHECDFAYISKNPNTLSTFTKRQLESIFSKGHKDFDFDIYREYLLQFGISGYSTVDELSKGEKKCLYLSLILATCPKVIVIDEIFSGLDEVNKATLISVLLAYIRSGEHTCVISTNQLEEIIHLTDYFILVNEGMIYQGISGVDLVESYKTKSKKPNQISLQAYTDTNSQSNRVNLTVRKPDDEYDSLISILLALEENDYVS